MFGKFYLWLFSGISVAIILGGCGSHEISLPTAPAVETAAAPTPTHTRMVAATPTATLSPVAPTSLPSPTPDLSAFNRQARLERSPDGSWSAIIVISYPENPDGSLFGDQYHTFVKLVNSGENQQWKLVDEWLSYGLGYTTPRVLGWSGDGRFAYLGDGGVPDGCGPRFMQNLRRVELASGEIAPLALDIGQLAEISPQGDLLVSFKESELLIHDLNSGEKSSVPFGAPPVDWWPDSVAWSQDSDLIIFGLSIDPCGNIGETATSIVLVNLMEKSAQELVQAYPRRLSIRSWPADDFVLLRDQLGQSWWLQVSTGEIDSIPPQEIAEAETVLRKYFDALYHGSYEEVVQLYGGDYEVLINNNPEVDRKDYAELWRNACQVNGFQCLQASTMNLMRKLSPAEYHFEVTFMNPGGSLFKRGPCCGAEITDMPPESAFVYTVIRDPSGRYLVVDLPVYIP